MAVDEQDKLLVQCQNFSFGVAAGSFLSADRAYDVLQSGWLHHVIVRVSGHKFWRSPYIIQHPCSILLEFVSDLCQLLYLEVTNTCNVYNIVREATQQSSVPFFL